MKTNRHSTLLKKAVHLITYNSSHKLICLLGYLLLCSMNTYAQNYVSGTVKGRTSTGSFHKSKRWEYSIRNRH